MLAADPNFEICSGCPAFYHGQIPQLTYTWDHYGLEGILGENAVFNVFHQEIPLRIIPAVAKGELGQVVGSE